MSILIKGMKMPEKCGLCDLFHVELPMHCTAVKGHKTVGAPYGMPRPDWCPIVEITEPHGALIDLEVLKAHIDSECVRRRIFTGITIAEAMKQIADEVPVVIEGSGENV